MRRRGSGFTGCLLQASLMVCISGTLVAGLVGWRAASEGVGLGDLRRVFAPRPGLEAGLNRPATKAVTGRPALPPPTPVPPATPIVLLLPTATLRPVPSHAPAVAPSFEPTASTTQAVVEPPGPSPTSPPSQLPTSLPTAPVSEAAINSLPIYAGSPLPERPATRLVIPSLNVDQGVIMSPIVDQTWQVDHLDQQIGHLEGTASPGQESNVVLAGHVTLAPDGRPGPFKNLERIQAGEVVVVYQGDQPFFYVIDTLNIVQPTDVQVTFPTSSPQLTLISCTNWDYSQGRYADRLVARGHLVETGN